MSDIGERKAETAALLKRINDAWLEESRQGLRPAPLRDIQQALVPPGGDWRCVAQPGAVTRSIFWNNIEAALINPRGDLDDATEGHIAMGMCAMPIVDKALRVIFSLAADPINIHLIKDVARAAIGCIERPAPAIPEPDEEHEQEDE